MGARAEPLRNELRLHSPSFSEPNPAWGYGLRFLRSTEAYNRQALQRLFGHDCGPLDGRSTRVIFTDNQFPKRSSAYLGLSPSQGNPQYRGDYGAFTSSRRVPEPLRTEFQEDLVPFGSFSCSQGEPQYGDDYEAFTGRRRVPKPPKTETQDDLDKAIRLWKVGTLLNGMDRYRDAVQNIQESVEFYRIGKSKTVGATDLGYGALSEAEEEALMLLDDLLAHKKYELYTL